MRRRTRNRQGRKERLDKKSPRFKRWVILGQRIPLSLYFDRSPLSHIDGDLWNSAGERRKRKAFSFCFFVPSSRYVKGLYFLRQAFRALLAVSRLPIEFIAVHRKLPLAVKRHVSRKKIMFLYLKSVSAWLFPFW